jgi:TatA/E family protein of Tat protein translocase
MNLGAPEILFILFVALLVFGPQRLPEIGRQVGGAMRELRRMQDSVKSELHSVMQDTAPQYSKPVSAQLPGRADRESETGAPPDEPPDGPTPPAAGSGEQPGPGFDGPSGSFQ